MQPDPNPNPDRQQHTLHLELPQGNPITASNCFFSDGHLWRAEISIACRVCLISLADVAVILVFFRETGL